MNEMIPSGAIPAFPLETLAGMDMSFVTLEFNDVGNMLLDHTSDTP